MNWFVIIAVCAILNLAGFLTSAQSEMFIYPKDGQSAEQQELEQRVKLRAASVVTYTRIARRGPSQYCVQHQHHRAESVDHQHDTERRRPAAYVVGVYVTACSANEQRTGDRREREHRHQRDCAMHARPKRREHEQRSPS